jgi:hypothetical protein
VENNQRSKYSSAVWDPQIHPLSLLRRAWNSPRRAQEDIDEEIAEEGVVEGGREGGMGITCGRPNDRVLDRRILFYFAFITIGMNESYEPPDPSGKEAKNRRRGRTLEEEASPHA